MNSRLRVLSSMTTRETELGVEATFQKFTTETRRHGEKLKAEESQRVTSQNQSQPRICADGRRLKPFGREVTRMHANLKALRKKKGRKGMKIRVDFHALWRA